MKILNRRWALALITASMFGSAGATVAATADAAVILNPCKERPIPCYPPGDRR